MITNGIIEILASLYKKQFEYDPCEIICLRGDGSDRKVFRLNSSNRPSIIGVFGPNTLENEAFISFSRTFYHINLPVPFILDYDPVGHVYLEEDLGDLTLYDWMTTHQIKGAPPKIIVDKYRRVISWLVQFQINGHRVVDYDKCYQFPSFQNDAIRFDLNYFSNSFLHRFARITIDSDALEKDFATLTSHLVRAESRYFLYRDFQSRNIMLFKNETYFIDYQSGRQGALQYDLASLLFDANLKLPASIREELLDYYIELLSEYEVSAVKTFKDYYFDFVLIRMLQALAAFAHLALDKKKTYFLKNIPLALSNIAFLLDQECIIHKLPEIKRIFINDLLINPLFEGSDFR